MRRLGIGALALALLITGAPAPEAVAKAPCAEETKALKDFKKHRAKAKHRFFKAHKSHKARKAFKHRQTKKLNKLRRARAKCLAGQQPGPVAGGLATDAI